MYTIAIHAPLEKVIAGLITRELKKFMSRQRERERKIKKKRKRTKQKPKEKQASLFSFQNSNSRLLSRSGRGRANLQGVANGIRQAAGNGALSPVKGVVGLTNLGVVGSKQLLLRVETQSNKGNKVHEVQDDAGHSKRVRNGGGASSKLVAELDVVLVEPAAGNGGAVKSGNVVSSKETSENGSHVATNTVEGKDVETVINLDQVLEGSGVVAGNSSDGTNGHGKVDGDETCSRSNSNKAGNGARAHANGSPSLFISKVVNKEPSHGTAAGSQVGVGKSVSSADGTVTGGATVEAKPAKPQKDGAKDNGGDGVGLEHGETLLLSIGVVTLAADKSVGKSTGTRGHVDGATTGVVKITQGGKPSARVPGPAGNGGVDDGQPDEKVKHHGAKSGALVGTTNHNHTSNGSKHTLVDHVEDIGHGRDDGGSTQAVLEAKVLKSTNELVGVVGKGQRVAPEEPLEGNEGRTHNGGPQQRHRVLLTGQSRVQQTDTGNHDPDQGGGGHNPDHVGQVEL